MRRIERRITISAPVPNVFSYLADFPRHSEWAAQPLRIRQTSEGPVGVGSTFVSVGHQFGRENENHITVVEFIPNEKIVFESEGRAGRFRHYFTMREDNGITNLAKGVEIIQASLALRLLSPILAALRVIGRVFDGDLRRIKAKLEEVAG